MQKKKLHFIPTIFLLVVFCTMALLFAGCYFTSPEIRAEQEDAEQIERIEEKKRVEAEELEQIAKEQAEYEEAKEKEKKDAEAEEEERLIDNEPITYSGNIDGVPVILIVNFKTTEVTGSLSLSGEDYIDAPINGKIDINTFKITSNYSGIAGTKELGEFPFNGTITGIITDDLSTFNGEIQPDYEDTGTKFTATK